VEAGKKFVQALTLHSHVANIGDVRSLVIHPASTTHSQLSAQDQAKQIPPPGPFGPGNPVPAAGAESANEALAAGPTRELSGGDQQAAAMEAAQEELPSASG